MRSATGWILLSIVAATAVQAELWVDTNESADFSAYRTYAWKEGTPARRHEVEQDIRAFVERELDGRGLRKVDAGADVFVLTHALVDKHTLEQLADSGYLEFWSGVRSIDAYDLGAGTLVIDLLDAKTSDIVWRGVANATISGAFDKNVKKIDKLVRKLFKSYPRE